MATIIKIKRSSLASTPNTLGTGELAYTYGSGTQVNAGDRLFVGTGTETNGAAARPAEETTPLTQTCSHVHLPVPTQKCCCTAGVFPSRNKREFVQDLDFHRLLGTE